MKDIGIEIYQMDSVDRNSAKDRFMKVNSRKGSNSEWGFTLGQTLNTIRSTMVVLSLTCLQGKASSKSLMEIKSSAK